MIKYWAINFQWKFNIISEIVFWFTLGIALIVLFPVTSIQFDPDSITYLNQAYTLYSDHTYDRTFRGPMMAIYGAFAIGIGEGNAFNVIYLPRIAFIFTVISFGIMMRILYGKIVLPYSIIMILFMPVLHIISTKYHVDVFVLPTTILSVCTFYLACYYRSMFYAIASGLLLGIAFLTKEIVLLLLPVWLFGWLLFKPINKKIFIIAITSLSGFSMIVFLWFSYVLIVKNIGMLDVGTRSQGGPLLIPLNVLAYFYADMSQSLFSWILGIPATIKKYYLFYVAGKGTQLYDQTSYMVIIIIAQVVLIARVIAVKKREDMFVLLLMLCLCPLILFIGENKFDLRQSAIIQVFSLFSLGCLLSTFQSFFRFLWSKERFNPNIFALYGKTDSYRSGALVVISIFVAIFCFCSTGFGRVVFYDNPGAYKNFVKSDYYFEPIGLLRRVHIETCSWLQNNVNHKAKVMTTYRRDARMFNAIMDMQFVPMPVGKGNIKHWRISNRVSTLDNNIRYRNLPELEIAAASKPIIVYLNRGDFQDWIHCLILDDLRNVGDELCRFYYFDEKALFDRIERHNIEYLLLGSRFRVMENYYKNNDAFELITTVKASVAYHTSELDEIKIFRVINTENLIDIEPIVSSTFPQLLQVYEILSPIEAKMFIDDVFVVGLNIDNKNVKKLINGDVKCFSYNAKDVKCERVEDIQHLLKLYSGNEY